MQVLSSAVQPCADRPDQYTAKMPAVKVCMKFSRFFFLPSVFARLILLASTSGGSSRLMREASDSADLLILLVPSCTSKISVSNLHRSCKLQHNRTAPLSPRDYDCPNSTTQEPKRLHRTSSPVTALGIYSTDAKSKGPIVNEGRRTERDMTRAPAGGMKASGILNILPPRPPSFFHFEPPNLWLKRSAMSLASSICCR